MTEGEPKFEEEKDFEQRLTRLLREKGIEDPEVKDLLIQWTIEQEKRVEGSGDSESPIRFNLRRARLYFEAGYTEEAIENFEAARTQALNEQRNELYWDITDEMIERKILEEEK